MTASGKSVEVPARRAYWALLDPKLKDLDHLKKEIARAKAKDDADNLRIIVWYLTDYWPATHEKVNSHLHGMYQMADLLRKASGQENVSHFFKTETLNEIERYEEALSRKVRNLNTLVGYQDIIIEMYLRPEIIPMVEHLIYDRAIMKWDEMKPIISDLLTTDSKPLLSGVL